MFKPVAALAGALAVFVALPAATALAQGAQQTVALIRVDVQKVATGHRASKLIGANVVNDANESIGKIDDLIVANDGRALFAVLSVGGFLGMGDRLVAVHEESLKVGDKKVTLPGATKDQLKALPEFKYAR